MARRFACLGLSVALLAGPVARGTALEPSPELRARVDAAIARGLDHLRARRLSLGGIGSESAYPLGVECLTFYTLLVCGLPEDDPFAGYLAAKARAAVQEAPHTYTVSLALLGLLLSDREQNAARINDAVERLVAGQLKQDDAGAWGYLLPLGRTSDGRPSSARTAHWDAPPDWWDNSNTQYGVLALRSAVDFGVHVDPAVFRRAADHFLSTQSADGGFPYDDAGHRSRSYVAMTAGVAGSLVMCRDLLGEGAEARSLRRKIDRSLGRSTRWLGRHIAFPPDDSPWPYYAAYGIERFGHYADEDAFGKVDWYVEGARWLVDAQREDGSWDTATLFTERGSGRTGRDFGGFVTTTSVTDTCFALLFLERSSAVHTRVSDEVLVLLRSIDGQARPADLATLQARMLDAGPHAIPQLVKGLYLPVLPARVLAADTLRRLTGEDFGYGDATDEGERRAARERWVRWFLARRGPSDGEPSDGGER